MFRFCPAKCDPVAPLPMSPSSRESWWASVFRLRAERPLQVAGLTRREPALSSWPQRSEWTPRRSHLSHLRDLEPFWSSGRFVLGFGSDREIVSVRISCCAKLHVSWCSARPFLLHAVQILDPASQKKQRERQVVWSTVIRTTEAMETITWVSLPELLYLSYLI